MLKIEGKYNTAAVYADELEKGAVGQLTALCNQEFTTGLSIKIMPDAHAGSGCVIGTTMSIKDKIVPNLVGADIGCGLEIVNLGNCRLDFKKLEGVIRNCIPSGFAVRSKPHRYAAQTNLAELTCAKNINQAKALNSIGTLGGGNHFIEIAKAEQMPAMSDYNDLNDGDYYLIIHSGSRHAGLETAAHHQDLAGRHRPEGVPYELAWLAGDMFADYVNDMKIMVEFADINRKAIADEIIRGMKWKAKSAFAVIHNYLDTDNMILRKGAVSAQKGERLLIPVNMRDGSLLCEGLGNPEWNYSAPHGAGRLLSRQEAKESITLTQFKQAMTGIYSSSIRRDTIDESPQAYKPAEKITRHIGETVKIITVLKPVFNFKA